MSNKPYYLPHAGIGSVGSYQISGIPWASSSLVAPTLGSEPLEVSFPFVTKFIVIKNVNSTSVPLRVGFSSNGVKNSNNYFLLSKNESFEGELRVTDIYLMSDNGTPVSASVIAGLTSINLENLPTNWSGSDGIG